jgi:hypothetical protein
VWTWVVESLNGVHSSRRRHPEAPRFLQRGEGSHAQPAQRVSQADPPLFFFLVFCMLHGPMFSSRSHLCWVS